MRKSIQHLNVLSVFTVSGSFHLHLFFLTFLFSLCVSLHAFHLCFIERTKGVEEGGEAGAKQEETVQEEPEVKEEVICEAGRGKEITETGGEERSREPGEEGKSRDALDPGAGGQRCKEPLRRSLSQDDDR